MKNLKDIIIESFITESIGVNFDLMDIFNAKSKDEFDELFIELLDALKAKGEKAALKSNLTDSLIQKEGKRMYILLKEADKRKNDYNANLFSRVDADGNSIYFGSWRYAQHLFWSDKNNRVENTLFIPVGGQPLGFKDMRCAPDDELYYLPTELEASKNKLDNKRTR